MIRFLQNLENVNVDATKKASAETKRGMFVTVNELNGTFAPATNLDTANGIVVRDTVVDEDVAQGFPISEYQDTQDIIKANEFAGVRVVFKGEQFATDQYDNSLNDDQAKAGKYLTVSNGKLATSPSATGLVSLGWYTDAGHKLLAYKVL